MPIIKVLLLSTHSLAAAAFFGSLFYSWLVLQPRIRRFFAVDQDRERFLIHLAHRNRYTVLLAFAVIGVSGIALAILRHAIWPLLLAKVVLFVVSLLLFAHISWQLWPTRLFAIAAELPHLDRAYRRAGYSMLMLAAANFVLGIALSSL